MSKTQAALSRHIHELFREWGLRTVVWRWGVEPQVEDKLPSFQGGCAAPKVMDARRSSSMAATNLGDGLLESTGLRVPDVRRRATSGSATPWVLLVFAIGAGGFFSYDFLGRAQNARAAADRAEAELKLTRQRAFEAEKKQADAEGALATMKAENDRLATAVAELDQDRKKAGAKTAAQADALVAELVKSIDGDEAQVSNAPGKLSVDVLEKALFAGNKTELSAGGKKLLRKLGETLNRHPDRSIWVIAHADDKPGWDVASARAAAVVRYLVEEVKLDPRRLTAGSTGAKSRSRSSRRRLEVTVLPKEK
jgi:chemotaxis protein MotB